MSDPKSVEIREHFVGFLPVSDSTGQGLADVLLMKLEQMSLPLQNLRGQGYDNGANMTGKHKGVQKRIRDLNPRAFFIPCNAHTLNLVVNDAAHCSLDAVSFFHTVQNIYTFFSASTNRWDVLKSHISNITVKPLSDTRWSSRIDALAVLRYHLGEVYDALVAIEEDTALVGVCGTKSRAEAKGIAAKVSTYKFCVSLVIWYKILFEVNITSLKLQAKNLDVSGTTKQIHHTTNYLKSLRSDEGYESLLLEATKLANDLNVEAYFPPENRVRRRKKKTMFSYEAENEPIHDPKEYVKVNMFFNVLDTAIQSTEERFAQMDELDKTFGFLFHLDKVAIQGRDHVIKQCMDLEIALTDDLSSDISAVQLCDEVISISPRLALNTGPADALNYIANNSLIQAFPNLVIALRILLTLPVSVASGERSFSKLKLIKTYLRSTLSQQRLVGLATLSIENELAQKIDLKSAVKDFASKKARKVLI